MKIPIYCKDHTPTNVPKGKLYPGIYLVLVTAATRNAMGLTIPKSKKTRYKLDTRKRATAVVIV